MIIFQHELNKSKTILSRETFIYILFQLLNELFSYLNLFSVVNKMLNLDEIISELDAEAGGYEQSASSNSRKSFLNQKSNKCEFCELKNYTEDRKKNCLKRNENKDKN